MKKLLFVLMLAACLILAGCAAKTTTSTTTLPAGAINTTDASAYRVLSDAKAFLSSIQSSTAAGTLTLTAAQKTVVNNLITASNTADQLWEAYHAGASTDAAGLTTAVNNLNSALATAQAQIVVGNK
jgi:PBP1b-binding outer membrane lipoprotein LpoB